MAKKFTIDNPTDAAPAAAFLSDTASTAGNRQGGRKVIGNEAKTRRVHLLMKPSTYEKLKRLATKDNRTVGDYIGVMIDGIKE